MCTQMPPYEKCTPPFPTFFRGLPLSVPEEMFGNGFRARVGPAFFCGVFIRVPVVVSAVGAPNLARLHACLLRACVTTCLRVSLTRACVRGINCIAKHVSWTQSAKHVPQACRAVPCVVFRMRSPRPVALSCPCVLFLCVCVSLGRSF